MAQSVYAMPLIILIGPSLIIRGVDPSVLSKLRQSKHAKRLEALQGIEDALM